MFCNLYCAQVFSNMHYMIALKRKNASIQMDTKIPYNSDCLQISKQSLPKWWDTLKSTYGKPKSANVANTIFQVRSERVYIYIYIYIYISGNYTCLWK